MMVRATAVLVTMALMLGGSVRAGEGTKEKAVEAAKKAAAYLVKQANAEGTFGKSQMSPMPGIVGLALYAIAQCPGERTAEEKEAVERAAAYLLKCQQENGAISLPAFGNDNYNTCVAAMALKALNNPKYGAALEKAKAYILSNQMDEKKGYNEKEHYQAFGGIGYGNSKRPDLSNTAFAIEALKELGMDEKSEEFKKALIFVRRCQDSPETNDVPTMKDGDGTGAFQYLPGDTEACSEMGMAKTRKGKDLPKPYGNMTYQGIKSLIHLGLSKDEPELQRAWNWIKNNYSVKEQPGGRSDEGYFYYIVAFAKAFTAAGVKELEVAGGRKVSWAEDLSSHVATLQNADGSFANKTPRWMESDPILSTSYALIALDLCVQAMGQK
jgi:squalene-hopene/tetraprenyl-beta-curcumene cyclase